jgi:acetyl esterase/lipase
MDDAHMRIGRAVTRRTALAGLSTGALGVALAGRSHQVSSAQTPAVESLQQDPGVVYGTVDGADLALDVVRPPDRPAPRPAVVVIHGGGLIQGERYDLSDAAIGLAQAGYATFSIDYRLFSQTDGTNPWPAQLDDVQRAVRWVRANAATYGVDSERIGAYGWSSGGQLAAFLTTRDTRDNSDPELAALSSRVTCGVAMGGLFDFTFPDAHPSYADLDAELLGGSLDALPDAEAYEDFSPISFVDATSAPLLILQEGSEDVIPYEQGRRMVAALLKARVQVSYGWFPDYDHGTWAAWGPQAPETLAFFGRHLNPDQ